jgi:hypothetical protein
MRKFFSAVSGFFRPKPKPKRRIGGWGLMDVPDLRYTTPEVKVGDQAINPEWEWVEVQNPNGRCTANGFNEFGETVGIGKGAKLTVVAIEDSRVLVSYKSPRGQGAGSEAGNGTLFFVPTSVFASMTRHYEAEEKKKAECKNNITELLRNRNSSNQKAVVSKL